MGWRTGGFHSLLSGQSSTQLGRPTSREPTFDEFMPDSVAAIHLATNAFLQDSSGTHAWWVACVSHVCIGWSGFFPPAAWWLTRGVSAWFAGYF